MVSANKAKKSDKNKFFKRISVAFAIFSGITHFWWIWDIANPFDSLTFCKVNVYVIGPNWYAIFKGFQAIILVLRLYEVYDKSALGYNKKALTVWAVFLSLWTLFTVIIQNVTTTVELRIEQVPQCHLLVATPFLASMVLFDIVSGIVNGYLFIRPIYKLRSLKNVSTKLAYIARKQRVLSITAIISSIIANFGIALIDIPQFNAGFDIVISMTCILLMYSWNEHMYKKVCCCCVRKIKEQQIAAEITAGSTKETVTNNELTVTTTDNTTNKSTSGTTAITIEQSDNVQSI